MKFWLLVLVVKATPSVIFPEFVSRLLRSLMYPSTHFSSAKKKGQGLKKNIEIHKKNQIKATFVSETLAIQKIFIMAWKFVALITKKLVSSVGRGKTEHT